MLDPLSIVRAVVRLASSIARIAVRARPPQWGPHDHLPVAGIDGATAEAITHYLKQLSSTEAEGATADLWLCALQLAQIAHDRLLHDLGTARQNLVFWQERLKAGSHTLFLLLNVGPASFAKSVLSSTGVLEPEETATERMSQRIAFLQYQSSRLAEALAEVNLAAGALREAVQPPGAGAGAGAGAEQQQQAVLRAVLGCANAIQQQLQQLEAAAEQWELQQGPTRLQQEAALRALLPGAPPGSERASSGRAAAAAAGEADAPLQQQQQEQGSGSSSSSSEEVAVAAVVEQLLQLQVSLGLGLGLLVHSGGRRGALHALQSARSTAARQGSLAAVPRWAAMPSRFQRHWLKYAAGGALALGAARWLYRHSRLGGSDDLQRWGSSGAAAVRSAWRDHVCQPLLAVRNELFATFRDRPSIVSPAEFEADKQSLMRMLQDFERDRGHRLPPPPPPLAPSPSSDPDPLQGGMASVMSCYEQDLQSPLRSLLGGDLARTLLIQVQRLKVDTEAAMLELDQILRANELSISLVAAVPALALGGALLGGLARLVLRPRAPDPSREAVPVRLAMVQLERALQVAAQRSGAPDAEGLVVYHVNKVYRRARAVYRLRDTRSPYSEWPQLQQDLMELARPGGGVAARLVVHNRMMATYTVCKP